MSGRDLTVAMLGIAVVLYVGAAIGYWVSGRHGMAIAFAGYTLANLGLLADAVAK